MANQTFVGWTEDMIVDVVESLADDIEAAIEELMPDGRPFGTQEMSDDERVSHYVTQYRGNPDAWANLVRTQVQSASQQLAAVGLAPDKVMSGHLYNAVLSRAFKYSSEMEDLIRQTATSGVSVPNGAPENGTS